jgi:hypothetical protein
MTLKSARVPRAAGSLGPLGPQSGKDYGMRSVQTSSPRQANSHGNGLLNRHSNGHVVNVRGARRVFAVTTSLLLLVSLLLTSPSDAAQKKPAKNRCMTKKAPTRLGSLRAGVVPVSGTKLVIDASYTGFTIEIPGRKKAIGPFTGTSPKFIGDGSRIFYSQGLLIRAVRSDGTGDTPIVCGFNPSTTSDGDSIFFGGVNGLDRSFRLDRNVTTATVVSDTGGSIAVSPDGRMLAFDEYAGSKRIIKVLEFANPVRRALFEMNLDGFGATETISWSADSTFIFAGLIKDPCCSNPLDEFYKISVAPPGSGIKVGLDESYSQRAPERTVIP